MKSSLSKGTNRDYLYGLHPVLESLKANRRKFYTLYLGEKIKNSTKEKDVLNFLQNKKIPHQYLTDSALTSLCGREHHQQLVLECGTLPKFSLEELLAPIKQQNKPLGKTLNTPPDKKEGEKQEIQQKKNIWVALDHLQDTQNIGSILRSCLYFGVKNIFLNRHRSPSPSPTISKISSGAMERIDFCIVNNLNSLIEKLKQEGFWIVGTALQGKDFSHCEVPQNCLLILGNEQKGMQKLNQKKCDFLWKITGSGGLDSLNVASAAAIFLNYIFTNE